MPTDWREGVALLATLPPPSAISAQRWAVLAATAGGLLIDHGAGMHAAGWGTLDLFGLYAPAPVENPAGWGLAWLLGEDGVVLDVSREAIGMRQGARGARLALYRRGAVRPGVVPVWKL